MSAADTGVLLVIDNDALYPGMDRTYSNGYIPTVTDNTASVILPLKPTNGIESSTVRVSVDLGNPDNSPFVFENLNQTVALREHTVDGGSRTLEAYLIDLALPLTADRQSGRYPVILSVQGTTEAGDAFEQTFTVYVTVDGAAQESEPPPEADVAEALPDFEGNTPAAADEGVSTSSGSLTSAQATEPPPQPKSVISGFAVDPWPIIAGQEFSITVNLQNTNTRVSMRNVKVTLHGETDDIVSAGEAGSFYFAEVKPEETVSVSSRLLVQPGITNDAAAILIHADYEGADRTAFTADEQLVLQVRQPVRLEVDAVNIPAQVSAGETLSVSVNVMNMGRSTVHNIRAQLEAPGLVPEGSLFLGNLESGSAKRGELYAFVDFIDANGGMEQRYGETAGRVILTYENAFAEEEVQEMIFVTDIQPPLLPQTAVLPEEESENRNPAFVQWWVSVAAAGGVLAVLIAFLRRRRQQKTYEEDDA